MHTPSSWFQEAALKHYPDPYPLVRALRSKAARAEATQLALHLETLQKTQRTLSFWFPPLLLNPVEIPRLHAALQKHLRNQARFMWKQGNMEQLEERARRLEEELQLLLQGLSACEWINQHFKLKVEPEDLLPFTDWFELVDQFPQGLAKWRRTPLFQTNIQREELEQLAAWCQSIQEEKQELLQTFHTLELPLERWIPVLEDPPFFKRLRKHYRDVWKEAESQIHALIPGWRYSDQSDLWLLNLLRRLEAIEQQEFDFESSEKARELLGDGFQGLETSFKDALRAHGLATAYLSLRPSRMQSSLMQYFLHLPLQERQKIGWSQLRDACTAIRKLGSNTQFLNRKLEVEAELAAIAEAKSLFDELPQLFTAGQKWMPHLETWMLASQALSFPLELRQALGSHFKGMLTKPEKLREVVSFLDFLDQSPLDASTLDRLLQKGGEQMWPLKSETKPYEPLPPEQSHEL